MDIKNTLFFLPAFNEGTHTAADKNRAQFLPYTHSSNIHYTLQLLHHTLQDDMRHLFVYDDASTDDTHEQAKHFQQTHEWNYNLIIEKWSINKWKWGGFLQAYRHAVQNDISSIFCLDADLLYIEKNSILECINCLNQDIKHSILPCQEMILNYFESSNDVTYFAKNKFFETCFSNSWERIVSVEALHDIEKKIWEKLFHEAFDKARFWLEHLLNILLGIHFSNKQNKSLIFALSQHPFRTNPHIGDKQQRRLRQNGEISETVNWINHNLYRSSDPSITEPIQSLNGQTLDQMRGWKAVKLRE